MSNNKVPSILDDNDIFNISEAENTKPFYDLKPFVHEFAPEYLPIVDKILRGEDVKRTDISKLFNVLIEKEMPYLDRDGIADSKMARLDELMHQMGGQL
jgi:hypothetical protein